MAKYRKLKIELAQEQRASLEKTVRNDVGGAKEIRRANVLLLADEAGDRKRQKDIVIASMLGMTPQAVHDIKQHFLDRTAESDSVHGIKRKKQETPPVPAKCTGDVEAKIAAIACSTPPSGRGKWTLILISKRAVEMEVLPSISYVQVGRILKKPVQASLEEDVVHSSRPERLVRGLYGGRPEGVLQTTNPSPSSCLQGRAADRTSLRFP